MFSTADAYERFMGRWSRRLAPAIVEFADVRDGDRVLDVGCGTGAITAAVAAAAPGGRTVGIDLAAAYVAFARARESGSRTGFIVGDAQRLPFRTGSFTRALSLLNLNFISDPAQAVQEMSRVTRPGGTVAAAVWDYGRGMEMLRVFWDEAVAMRRDADTVDERHMRLATRGELGALFEAQRLRSVVEQPVTIETRFASFDDYWTPFLDRQGPAGAYVATLPAALVEELRLRLRRRLLADEKDHPIVLSARAWTVRGAVPGDPASGARGQRVP